MISDTKLLSFIYVFFTSIVLDELKSRSVDLLTLGNICLLHAPFSPLKYLSI